MPPPPPRGRRKRRRAAEPTPLPTIVDDGLAMDVDMDSEPTTFTQLPQEERFRIEAEDGEIQLIISATQPTLDLQEALYEPYPPELMLPPTPPPSRNVNIWDKYGF